MVQKEVPKDYLCNTRHFKRMYPDFKSSVEEQKGPHLKLNDLDAHPSWEYELREVNPFFDSHFLHLLTWSNDNAAHLMVSLWKVRRCVWIWVGVMIVTSVTFLLSTVGSNGSGEKFCEHSILLSRQPGQVAQANSVVIKPYSSHKY